MLNNTLQQEIENTLINAGFYSMVELEETRPKVIEKMPEICAYFEKEFEIELLNELINVETLANYIFAIAYMGDESKLVEVLVKCNQEVLVCPTAELDTLEELNELAELSSHGFLSSLVINVDGVQMSHMATNALGNIVVKIHKHVFNKECK